MFHSSKKLLALRGAVDGVLAIVDDMLVGMPPEDVAAAWADGMAAGPRPGAPHPHRRPVRLRVERRDGAIAPRPMQCLCPVRATPPTPTPVDRDLAR